MTTSALIIFVAFVSKQVMPGNHIVPNANRWVIHGMITHVDNAMCMVNMPILVGIVWKITKQKNMHVKNAIKLDIIG
jgi:hypothetical protein